MDNGETVTQKKAVEQVGTSAVLAKQTTSLDTTSKVLQWRQRKKKYDSSTGGEYTTTSEPSKSEQQQMHLLRHSEEEIKEYVAEK